MASLRTLAEMRISVEQGVGCFRLTNVVYITSHTSFVILQLARWSMPRKTTVVHAKKWTKANAY